MQPKEKPKKNSSGDYSRELGAQYSPIHELESPGPFLVDAARNAGYAIIYDMGVYEWSYEFRAEKRKAVILFKEKDEDLSEWRFGQAVVVGTVLLIFGMLQKDTDRQVS